MPPTPDPIPPAAPARGWRSPLRTTSLLSLLALCTASPLAVVGLLGASAATGQPAAFGVPPGASDDGRSLPVVATVQAGGATSAEPGLQLRHGCRWGQPGRMPYRGSTRQALVAAGLPEEVVAQIEAKRLAGDKSGRVAISRDGIRHTGDGRVFPSRGFALTFGMTLCLDSSVNFPKGHEEMADLYEARDAQGKPHAVMVPDVCGNVSVLGERDGQGKVAGMSATLARRAQAMSKLADALDAQAAGTADDMAPAAGQARASGVRPRPADIGGDAATGGEPAAGHVRLSTDAAGDGSRGSTGRTPSPTALAVVGVVTDVLVPPQAAAGVVRTLGRVTAAAGRGLESLAGSPGGNPGGGGAGTAGGSPQDVPEPGSLWLAGLAVALLGLLRRR